MNQMKLLAFAASHRNASFNLLLLRLAISHLQQPASPFSISEIDYGALELPLFNQDIAEHQALPSAVKRVHTVFEAADALMIALPEYNWSYPGSLKNVIDWLSVFRPVPLAGKPTFLMSASPSPRGGMMGLSHFKTVLEGVDMMVYPRMFSLGNAPASLEEARLVEPKLAAQFTGQLDAFSHFCLKLQVPADSVGPADSTTKACE